MNKKIFYTILGAVVAVLLALLAWWWFLGQSAPAPSNNGGFGTAQNASGGRGGAGPETNIPSQIPGAPGGANASTQVTARTITLGQGSTLKNGATITPVAGQILLVLNSATPIAGNVMLGKGSIIQNGTTGTGTSATTLQSGGTLLGQVTLGPGSTIQNGQVTLGPGSTIHNGTVTAGTTIGSGGNTTVITNGAAISGTIVLGPGASIQNGQVTLSGSGNFIQNTQMPIGTPGVGTTVQNGTTLTNNNVSTNPTPIVGIVVLGPGTILPNGTTQVSNTGGTVVSAGPTITSGPPIQNGTILGNGTILQNNTNPLSNTSGNPITAGPPITGGPTIQTTAADLTIGQYSVPEVTWLNPTLLPITIGGSNTSNPAGTNRTLVGTAFNPTPINQVNRSNPSGGVIPDFGISNNGQGTSDGNGFLATAGIAAAAGAISCGAAQLFETGAAATGVGAGTAAVGLGEAAGTAAALADKGRTPVSVQTMDLGPTTVLSLGIGTQLTALGGLLGGLNGNATAKSTTDTFWGCIARTLAKVALQQITSSVVNWINSGFNGSPAFVQDPTSFFQNVADNAAGQYIKGSALSFLCSPFQLQIKIAIAKSYANRGAQSCTLTQITNNINGFMNGNFSAGGWGSLLQFTAVPTNNPYGAFAYASVGLSGSIAQAVGAKQNDLTLGGGFLSFQQKSNCRQTANPPSSSINKSVTALDPGLNDSANQMYTVCDLKTATPGRVIADALGATEKSTLDQLTLAKSFDEIISALISQLMTRTLQGGLSNLSGTSGYANNFITPDHQQAQTAGQNLLVQMQRDTSAAQQYGAIQQGSIKDIQSAQNHLQTLVNCWASAAAASTSPEKIAIASTNAAAASSTIGSFQGQVDLYNNHINLANQAIATLETLESRTLSAGSMTDIDTITQSYQAAQASGAFVAAADVTLAQQDRTTLQSQMAIVNQQTNAGLAQCYAF